MADLITFKLNTSAIPNYDKMSKLEKDRAEANSIYMIGPYSVSFEKAFQAFNAGVYKKQNQELLDRYHILSAANPIIATVNGGTKVTKQELIFMCMSEAYTSIIASIRNGSITVVGADGTNYSADTLQSWVINPATAK